MKQGDMLLYDLCISEKVWIIFSFILFKCTNFIQGTSIEILSSTCPGSSSCDNVTIEMCPGRCSNTTSPCFSPKFELKNGYKQVFKCSEKFINLVVAKVYFGKENYTLCEKPKGLNNTCLKHPTVACSLNYNLLARNSNNNYSLEVKIGDECTKPSIVPYILTGVGVAALILTAVIIYYNRKACVQCVKGIAQKV
ncbi:unnamed protein product [Mytilus edulis]|uniref:Uncharacterized protein n=1 Tax=Mytilus edulis TaxID=6550 RepID=A0A8S3PUG2_MYTED|nr:unnamed protein product [Mytilus edulis]